MRKTKLKNKIKLKNKTKLKKKTKNIIYQNGGVDNILPIPQFIKKARFEMSQGIKPLVKSLTQITTNKTDLIKLHAQIDQLSIPQRKSVQALVNTFLVTK